MNELTIRKADATHSGQDVPAATITIDGQLPRVLAADDARDEFREDARALAEMLWQTLPGGTIDALLVEMLDRRATLLRVPMPAGGPS